ncbi:MAG: isochorismate synthase [Dehalococcoidia bacterium]|nr:isochorismate synthase [Dehalococcoidia bacterium]
MVTVPALPEIAAQVAGIRARAGSGCFLGIRLPSSFNPVDLLHDVVANQVVASYERPDGGLALVAVGEAGRADAQPGEVPQAVREQVRALLRAEVVSEAPELRPRLLGGFAFDVAHAPTGPWAGFAAGSLVLPRLLFVRDGGVTGVVVAPGVEPAEIEALGLKGRSDERCLAEVRVARDIDRAGWLSAVSEVAADIRAGRYEKVVLAASREIEAESSLDVGGTLERLRAGYAHCHLFTVSGGGATFLGATPELLVSLRGGVVSALGLAGSAPRGQSTADDERLGEELLSSRKNRVEHEIVVRTLRDDLAPVTTDLEAADEPGLLRLPNIQHLATDVSGRARAGVDILELVGRLHPRPAVCGWPTETAIEVIRRHETFDRGWYAGPVGWMDASGEGEFAVALRSALVRGRRAWLFAGAGIMGDSAPEAELAEIEWKFTPLSVALGGAGVSR